MEKIKLQRFKAGSTSEQDTAIPSDELAVVLDAELKRIGKTQTMSANDPNEDSYAGAVMLVSERTANILNRSNRACRDNARVVTAETVYRRIMGILGGQSEVTDLTLADALMLACDRNINLLPLPVMPGSEAGARKMVDAYYPVNAAADREMRERLVHLLSRFSLGYLNGPLVVGDEDALARAEYRANLQKLKQQRKERRDADTTEA